MTRLRPLIQLAKTSTENLWDRCAGLKTTLKEQWLICQDYRSATWLVWRMMGWDLHTYAVEMLKFLNCTNSWLFFCLLWWIRIHWSTNDSLWTTCRRLNLRRACWPTLCTVQWCKCAVVVCGARCESALLHAKLSSGTASACGFDLCSSFFFVCVC